MLWLIISWPLMLGHDFHLCLTSYYAISNVLSPITNNSYTNATSCFKTIQRNLFWLNCHKLAQLDLTTTPSLYLSFFDSQKPLHQNVFPDIFGIKWSYFLNYGHKLDFIIHLPSMTSSQDSGEPVLCIKKTKLCQCHLIPVSTFLQSASTGFITSVIFNFQCCHLLLVTKNYDKSSSSCTIPFGGLSPYMLQTGTIFVCLLCP